jgi:HAE1 family hydrophobic/amphiphilic exporter-1
VRISHFFIERPIFAAVVAIFIVLVGGIAYPLLPTAQFPEIAPPTVTITATYPGASAATLAEEVAEPIEEQINGVEDMLYMSSQSTGDGRMQITVTFKLGTSLDKAQVLVQNRVAIAQPRLPQQVQQTGVTVRKSTPDLLLAIHFTSPDHSLDRQYIGNYVLLNVRDKLLRAEGVGDYITRGDRDFSIRVWIDPARAAQRQLNASDITDALSRSNVQVAAGSLNVQPTQNGGGEYQLDVQTEGRLTRPDEFANIVIKRDANGNVTRIRDIGRVELGAQQYVTSAYLNDDTALLLGLLQLPGSNALKAAEAVQAKLKDLQKDFPPGLKANIVYNPTEFIAESLTEVKKTLFEALLLVVVVVILFLQSWRAAVVPLLAIPISLVGTFAMMLAAGFSLNNLSMFGLVLAIGIVVDDAIVVVENISRLIEEGKDPRQAAHDTMDEVGGALIGIALVLCAVFIPAAAISGITGQFYRQFALTIATSTLISLLVSLTLSPSMAALLMRPKQKDEDKEQPRWRRPFTRGAELFNKGFDKLSDKYGQATAKLVRVLGIMFIIYAVLIVIAGWRVVATPTGFIPDQDQGTLLLAGRLPEGSSLARSEAVGMQINKAVLSAPGVLAISLAPGVDATSNTNASNAVQAYIILKPFADRRKQGLTVQGIIDDLQKRTAGLLDADVKVLMPPPVRGIGTAGGFKLIVEQTKGEADYTKLEQVVQKIIDKASSDPDLTKVFTSFNTKTPRYFADIDREKAQILGVTDDQVFSTLQTYLASSYINDFNYLGYTFQVRAQADWPYRLDGSDLGQLKARSATGTMVPLSSFVTLQRGTDAYRAPRYQLYPAAEIQGSAPAGKSSGQAIAAMEKIAKAELPDGFSYEWTEIAYQQVNAGNTGYIVFALAVLFVFLVLAALYESVTLPLAVLLIVPMCLLAAFVGIDLRGMDNNILTQVGLIVLVALAAKNAILIVEFAKQDKDDGEETEEAAVSAARTRLRPILMTSLAFILGVIPLAFAHGAGAEMRQALGTAVFFGMIGVTLFGLLFTPVFYVATTKLSERLPAPKQAPKSEADKRREERERADKGKDEKDRGSEPEPQPA